LGEDKSTSLAKVIAKYLITADGSSAFHASQLLALSNFPVTPGQVAATPQRLPPPVAAPVRPPGDSPMANAQSQNLLEPKEEEKEPDPQPRNPYRPTAVPLAQPTPETEPQNRNGTDPREAQVLALTGNARPVVHRICAILEDLVLPLFLKISDSTKEDQLVQKVNAKLEAALKKKATLDMGQALDDLIAKEPTVAHENMEGLVQSIVQRQLKNVEKRKKNEIVKEALKEARKNLREEKRAKTPSATSSAIAKRKASNQKLCKPFSASETWEEETIQRPRQGLRAMTTLAAEPVLESRPATHASGQPPLSIWTRIIQRTWLRSRPRPWRLQHCSRARVRLVLSNYLDRHQTAITVNIAKNSNYLISSTALRVYGFVPNPLKPIWENQNQLLGNLHPSQYFSSPSNMAFHNLCLNAQTPPGTDFLLGLGLKYCIEAPRPYQCLASSIQQIQRSVRLHSAFKDEDSDTDDEYDGEWA
jgi:hypothetical protein